MFGVGRAETGMQPIFGSITLEEAEKKLIQNTLIQTQGNKAQACRLLGISKPTLLRKLAQYKMDAN